MVDVEFVVSEGENFTLEAKTQSQSFVQQSFIKVKRQKTPPAKGPEVARHYILFNWLQRIDKKNTSRLQIPLDPSQATHPEITLAIRLARRNRCSMQHDFGGDILLQRNRLPSKIFYNYNH